jgi:hypothetical protein
MSNLAHAIAGFTINVRDVLEREQQVKVQNLRVPVPSLGGQTEGVVDTQTEAQRDSTIPSPSSGTLPPAQRGKLVISEDTADALMRDMSGQISQEWSSPLLLAFAEFEGDREAMRKLIATRLVDMLVTIGRTQREDPSMIFPIASAKGFTPPMLHEFLRRFPLSTEGLFEFMPLAHRDLKQAYNNDFKVHGEWGQLVWDRATGEMRISAG